MKFKTSELIGSALDWAVAKCEGVNLRHGVTDDERYSTDWAQGGPIIEQEGINFFRYNKLDNTTPWVWGAHKVVPRPNMEGGMNTVALCLDGPTPLIAAMRCYVASKLGDEVDVSLEDLFK